MILVRMLNKVVQRPLLVTRKATAPSAVMRSRQEKRSKGTCRFVYSGGVVHAISHALITFRDKMENDH